MDLLTFPPGVNQFCQDILDMICHCPPWCSKVLLYFKACWVFCTPFLLLVSTHLPFNISTCSQEMLLQYDTSWLLQATRFETGRAPPFYSMTMVLEVYFSIFLCSYDVWIILQSVCKIFWLHTQDISIFVSQVNGLLSSF